MISSDGTLAPTDHEVSDPRDGNLTVENDRGAIDVLCLVAHDLRSRLYLSGISQWSTEGQLAEAIGNKVFQGKARRRGFAPTSSRPEPVLSGSRVVVYSPAPTCGNDVYSHH